MIQIENIEVFGWKAAIRGMRNPMNSWSRSDSTFDGAVQIGPNDLKLMQDLTKGGGPHRKFLRMIHVCVDITAPLYWWNEFDTYKVGTVANSCSTMHKIHSKEFTLDDFSTDHLDESALKMFDVIIDILNASRMAFNITKNKQYWWNMIQTLPTSYNQKRTIDMNYETVINIIKYRTGHKLDEWNQFVDTMKDLPYLSEIYMGEDNG